ncbi:MAG: DsrE family protein [Gemmatimonadota bacterium]
MNARSLRFPVSLVLAALMLLPPANALSQEPGYAAMEGVTSVRAAFDFRVGDPDVALGHLDLIHTMLGDPSMNRGGERPEIVVVFIGPSVNLITTEESGVVPESKDAIAGKISEMEADGVTFEICMTAAHAHDVSAESVLPEVVQVGNGWISLIGYQHRGYAMIADF